MLSIQNHELWEITKHLSYISMAREMLLPQPGLPLSVRDVAHSNTEHRQTVLGPSIYPPEVLTPELAHPV